uniref:3-dehydroquinate dehydratase n=2 Tax=Panagrellus redivivus TaxID=6233 RepID=A0A7E4WC50_PANRE
MRPERIRKEARKAGRQLELTKEDDGIRRTPDGKIMCAVPLVACSRVGQPIPTDISDGVKLQCTNSSCRYTDKLLHRECFKSLEQGLLTILANQGSARGWTEAQRRHNLWERKGLTLVQRSLRCACGKGQVKRDEDAWNARMAILEPEEKVKPCKKKNKKALPSLNFNKRTTPAVDMKKVHELDTHFLSSHSPPPMSAFEEHYGTSTTSVAPRIRTITSESVVSGNTVRPSIPVTMTAPTTTPRRVSPARPPAPAVVVTGISRTTVPEPASKINAVEKWQQFRQRTSSNPTTPITTARTSSSATSIPTKSLPVSAAAAVSLTATPIPEAIVEADPASDAVTLVDGDQSSITSFLSARSTCSPLHDKPSVTYGRAPSPPRPSRILEAAAAARARSTSTCQSSSDTILAIPAVEKPSKETQTDLSLMSGPTALIIQSLLDSNAPASGEILNDSGVHSVLGSPREKVNPLGPTESLAVLLEHLTPQRRPITTSSPPGFDAEYRRQAQGRQSPTASGDDDGFTSDEHCKPLPHPPKRSKYYCLFDGPNVGLGERLVDLLASGTYHDFRC